MKRYELFIANGFEVVSFWGDDLQECLEEFAEHFCCVYEDIRDFKHYFIKHSREIIPEGDVIRELMENGIWSDDEAMDELPFA